MKPVKSIILRLIKDHLEESVFWEGIESKIALLCTKLPEPTTQQNKIEFIKQLMTIKEFIIENGIKEEYSKFLDEEARRYEITKKISDYIEDDKSIDPSIINQYSRLSTSGEGVLGIHLRLNYTQLSRLSQGVYNTTGLLKFYISKDKTIYGKIVAEVYEHPQKITVATLIESKKTDKETGEKERRAVLFGVKWKGTEYIKLREVTASFYVYRFITRGNEEYILITPTQSEIGDYIITGVITQRDDLRMLTNSARLPTKLPFIFAQEVKNRVIKFKNHTEFKARLDELKITRKDFFDFPFTIRKGVKAWKLLHPKWFKNFIWSFLTHQPKGLYEYPSHILMIGVKGAGKSWLLNGLHSKSRESRKIFSGSSSTLKHLVPSFKYNPARLGYLAESSRFAFCDEFLRCLARTHTSKDGSAREESVGMMNDLLEHQKREAGSGVSRVNVNMTARVIATTNPIRGVHTVEDLISTLDESFLSRWIIYYQTDEHVKMVRKCEDSELEEYTFKMDDIDWVSILDYLHSFNADYDISKVRDVHHAVPKILSEALNNHYDARHMHHIECVMDGIIKTRCLLDGDMSFKANEDDYKVLKEVWLAIIRSWIKPERIKNVDVKNRVFYLPEDCQYIYNKVNELKRPVTQNFLTRMFSEEMPKNEYITALNILLSNEVLVSKDGLIIPHWMNKKKGVE